jgi:hypothetical protein
MTTTTRDKEIVRRYLAGETSGTIATSEGITPQRVRQIIHDLGPPDAAARSARARQVLRKRTPAAKPVTVKCAVCGKAFTTLNTKRRTCSTEHAQQWRGGSTRYATKEGRHRQRLAQARYILRDRDRVRKDGLPMHTASEVRMAERILRAEGEPIPNESGGGS